MKKKVILFWFRRDLRIADNTALFHALMAGIPVLPIFIFDKNILDKLADKKDKRVQFIHSTLTSIQQELQSIGCGLEVIYATPQEAFEQLMKQYNIAEVYANHDYELYGIKRDEQIQALLKKNNIPFHTYKDQVVFEKSEVVKDDGKPYTIFTPYSRKWKATLEKTGISIQPSEKHIDRFMQQSPKTIISLKDMGFFPTTTIFPPNFLELELIKKYANQKRK
jgi:deoxyribodipyrimidine photo-lyase